MKLQLSQKCHLESCLLYSNSYVLPYWKEVKRLTDRSMGEGNLRLSPA